MDPFSLTIGTIALIGACRQTCVLVKDKYKAFSSAENDVLEIIARLDIIWNKAEIQLRVMRGVWHQLEPSLQVSQQTLVNILKTKLDRAALLLESVLKDEQDDIIQPSERDRFHGLLHKPPRLKRAKYALLRKDELSHLMNDFQEWANLFDPSWYFIAQQVSERDIQSLNITTSFSQLQLNVNVASSLPSLSAQDPIKSLIQLRKAARDLRKSPSDGDAPLPTYPIADLQSIPYSTASTGRLSSNDARLCVIDCVHSHPSADRVESLLAIKRLAKALTRMDPQSFGLLRCVAASNARANSDEKDITGASDGKSSVTGPAYNLVLQIPISLDSTRPSSLRALLLSGQRLSINARLSIAVSIATSLLYLSLTGFVHKNVRSDNVLVFHTSPQVEGISGWSAFLVGFEDFRLAEGTTYRSGDEMLRNEIYRHPQRQGRNPERRYHLRHDVYSFGVVLLEIGLWISLVDEEGNIVTEANGRMRSPVLSQEAVTTRNVTERATRVKACLASATQQHLPSCVGQKYANIVDGCLNDDSWDISEGDATLETSIQYVEEIINPLHAIVV